SVALTDEIVIRDPVNARPEADRQPLLRQAVAHSEPSGVHVGHREVHRGVRPDGRSDYLGLIARVHQIRAREVRDGPGGQLARLTSAIPPACTTGRAVSV